MIQNCVSSLNKIDIFSFVFRLTYFPIYREYTWRVSQLKAVVSMVREHEAEWKAAICKDVGKPEVEADISEIANVYSVAIALLRGLKSWMKPQQHSAFGLLFPASCEARARDYLTTYCSVYRPAAISCSLGDA